MSSAAKLEWPFQLKQLTVMIGAGMPIDTCLKSLSLRSSRDTAKLQKALRLVKRGVSLPDSFRRAELIGDFDHAMLSSADTAGRLEDGLSHISERRVNQLQRTDSFKVSLIFPKALVVILLWRV